MKEINLRLTQEDINFLQGFMGELPSKTGAAFLMKKISDQVEASVAAQVPFVDAKEVQ